MAQHILIIRFSSAGDIVLTSPFLRAVRRRYPDAHVDFAVKREFASLVEHSPYVDRVVALEPDAGIRTLMRLKSDLIAECRGEYDIVVDLHDSLRSRHLRFGLGRTLAVVRKPTLAKWLLVHRKIDRLRPIVPIPLRYLEAGRELGLEDDGRGLELHLGGAMSPVAAISERPTVAIAPGARHFTKQWPIEHYNTLARTMHTERGARIVLLGAESDRASCAAIAAGIPDAINLAGRTALLESAAAIDACDVVVTNDSAMAHIAAARQRPVVAIFGSTVRQFGFAPFRVESRIIENEGLYCRPCTSIGRDACPEGHFRCMREIAPDRVSLAAYDLMHALERRSDQPAR